MAFFSFPRMCLGVFLIILQIYNMIYMFIDLSVSTVLKKSQPLYLLILPLFPPLCPFLDGEWVSFRPSHPIRQNP